MDAGLGDRTGAYPSNRSGCGCGERPPLDRRCLLLQHVRGVGVRWAAGPGAVRDRGLVEQAVAAAFQTYVGVDPHPGPFDKAAMPLRGITQGHRFNDGNKRTGCWWPRTI